MRRSAAFFLISTALLAEDKWTYVKSGPFEVWTNGPDKHAKVRLAEAEQFRHALTGILGKQELKSIWPIRILAVQDKRATIRPLTLIRDSYVAVVPNEQPLGPDFRRAAARLFLDANTKRYPGSVDQGLEDILTAFDVNGTHLTLLAPPAANRSIAWARIHMMISDPAFSGRMRVYLSNLESGSDEGTACRNGFEKSAAEVEKLVQAWAAKTSYEPKPLSSRPINAERDYYPKTLPSEQARIAEVDAGMSKAVSLADLQTPESYETQEQYEKAVQAGSKSARAWFQFGMQSKDKSALQRAAVLNPLWGAPHAEMARLETMPARAVLEWKQAATLEVRNVDYWREYALAATKSNQFGEAAKAWTGAERAGASDDERNKLKQARLDLETQRADFSESERRKASEDRQRELDRLKADALADIRKAEMKANERLGGSSEAIDRSKLEKWWDGPKGEKVTGQLTKVDCLNGPARLTVVAGGKAKLLLVRDASKIAIVGSQNATLGCGPQKPVRTVTVEFEPKVDAKFGTAGDVLQVQFQ